MAKADFQSMDEYIATCPEETHERLQAIRAVVKRVVPNAKEKISYQIACFELNGRNVNHFAGWDKHVSLYPVPAGYEAFEKSISKHVDGKGTLKFSLDESLPLKLIEQVVKLRMMENEKTMKGKPK